MSGGWWLKWMKMPKRRCPCRIVPSLSVLSPERPSTHHDVVTLWRHDVTWVTSYVVAVNLHRPSHQKLQKSHFSIWRSWALTYDLDLQTHPRYYQGTLLYQILGPYIKRFSQESANRHTDAHTYTGPILYPRPLTREGTNCARSINPWSILPRCLCIDKLWWKVFP